MTQAKLIKKNAAICHYKEGKAIREIARELDITPKTVREYLRDYRMQEAKEAAERRRKRSASITKEVKDGGDRREIAQKYGVSRQTVNDTVRHDITEGSPEDVLYKLYMCAACHKNVLRRWAKKQLGGSIQTPEGIMTVLNAYPNIIECAKRYGDRYLVTTFTLGEVYYINQGR